MSKDVSLISYDKEIEIISKCEHYSADFHNTFGDIHSLHVRLTPLIDYTKDSEVAYHFYATIQNKFHYAITNHTAAEIVYESADHTKEHMGLTTWKNAPDGRILKSDVSVAKNYLNEKQIRQLERAVTGYFDYIEDLIERENVFTMEEFEKSVNAFLEFRQYKILKDNGRISHKQAMDKANAEYEVFNKTQPIESDFDKAIKKMLKEQN